MSISVKLRDSFLTSGSSDLLRSTIGGFYDLVEMGGTSEGLTLRARDVLVNSKIARYDQGVASFDLSKYPNASLIKNIYTPNSGAPTVASSSTSILPYYVYPVSIEGLEPDDDLSAENSALKWKSYIMGGEYAGRSYPGVLSEGVFDVSLFDYEYPYPKLYVKGVDNTNHSSYDTDDSMSVYNYHLLKYQKYNSGVDEFNMLNYYDLLQVFENSSRASYTDVSNFITLNGFVRPTTFNPFQDLNVDYPALSLTQNEMFDPSTIRTSTDSKFVDAYAEVRAYLNTFSNPELGIGTDVGARPETPIGNENLLFEQSTIKDLFSNATEFKNYIPYYNKIELPIFENSWSNAAITMGSGNDNFSSVLLKSIKDVFVENLLTTSENSYLAETKRAALDSAGRLVENMHSIENVTHKYIDFIQVLTELNNNPAPMLGARPERFVGTTNLKSQAAIDYTSLLRHIFKSDSYQELFKFTDEILNPDDSTSADYIPWADNFEISSFLNGATEDTYINKGECVALRIRKRNTISNNVQNIIIQNTPQEADSLTGTFSEGSVNSDDWCYYDSQVKYGVPYQYDVFAYFLVVGFKYQYADIALSRRINDIDTVSGEEVIGKLEDEGRTDERSFDDDYTCIEFYNPATGETVISPMLTAQPESMQPIRYNLVNNTFVTGYATEAQELAADGRVNWADFNLIIEPTVRLIEVPISSKELTVLDHPPPRMDVVPYQVKDQSQRIGFFVKLESFSKNVSMYPTPLNNDELTTFARYLSSNNMLDIDKLTFTTVSEPVTVEVYRTSKKPTAMTDFADSLVAEKNLILSQVLESNSNEQSSIRDENLRFTINKTYASTTCFYEDRIATSKKFYYAFRFVNENGMPSPWSPVVEAEMIDDGGYKYAVFNNIMQYELDDSLKYENPFEQFKKIFTLRPTIPQIDMDKSNLNYDNSATSEYNNVNLSSTLSQTVFDKKFKIRLTSKKTGKKIDLNVTYNIVNNTDYDSI